MHNAFMKGRQIGSILMSVANTVFFDCPDSDEKRRGHLYDGQLFVFSPKPSTTALCAHAAAMIEDAFEGRDPRTAQYDMAVEDYVAVLAPLKPRFIHNETTRRLVRDVLEDFGCDLDRTYQDVPRLRAVTSDGYLTSGVGYAHHPHRDTWYAAPSAQLNWWLPIWPMQSDSAMAFHPRYWSAPVKNGSADFNYYEWNATSRANAARHISSDSRKQPKPLEDIDPEPQLRLVVPPGGVILFSGAQMHSTVANLSGQTRYSIDFRTVDMDDVLAGRGAPNIDGASTGTSLRDFRRARDGAPMAEAIVERYDSGCPADGLLVFDGNAAAAGLKTLAEEAR